MRILAISAQKPEATGSGIYLRETVRAFQRMGHEVAILAGVAPGDKAELGAGIRFFPVCYETEALPFPVCGMSDEMPYRSTLYRNMSAEMIGQFRSAFGEAVKKAVEAFHPDVLLCHHLYLLTAHVRELFPSLPVWGVCHGTDLRQMYSHALAHDDICRGIRGLDRIFCLFDEQNAMIRSCYGAEEARIFTIGSGYNAELFHQRAVKPHTGTRLIFAGKISEKKGVFSLLRALSQLPEDYSLSLAGGWSTEEQKEKAVRAIAETPRRVELLGPLTQETLAQRFSESDVFVLPSFFEGFPLVLAEAMACGCRAVCTDLPGIRERMDALVPGHGVRFVPMPKMLSTDTPDPAALPAFEAALAAAIHEAVEMPPYSPDLSALSWDAVAKKMLIV